MLTFSQLGMDTVSIRLEPAQGKELKELIEKSIDCRFSTYMNKIGIAETNAHAVFRGTKKLSVKFLNRLLSNTDLELECHVEFHIKKKDGNYAHAANYPNLEDMLHSEIGDELEEGVLIDVDEIFTGIVNQYKKELPN